MMQAGKIMSPCLMLHLASLQIDPHEMAGEQALNFLLAKLYVRGDLGPVAGR